MATLKNIADSITDTAYDAIGESWYDELTRKTGRSLERSFKRIAKAVPEFTTRAYDASTDTIKDYAHEGVIQLRIAIQKTTYDPTPELSVRYDDFTSKISDWNDSMDIFKTKRNELKQAIKSTIMPSYTDRAKKGIKNEMDKIATGLGDAVDISKTKAKESFLALAKGFDKASKGIAKASKRMDLGKAVANTAGGAVYGAGTVLNGAISVIDTAITTAIVAADTASTALTNVVRAINPFTSSGYKQAAIKTSAALWGLRQAWQGAGLVARIATRQMAVKYTSKKVINGVTRYFYD